MRSLLTPVVHTLALLALAIAGRAADHPNVVVILADDLGYGDLHCLNTAGKIATPNLDRLAAEGMRFTDAHSGSAVCTPTRYGLLTGRYAWRTRLKSGVLGGMSPPLIEEGRQTIAQLFAQQGYATACIGKWHLGMTWMQKPGTPQFDDKIEKGADGWNADFSKPISHGPTSVGFARYFGISASLDMVPYVFIDNDHVTGQPDTDLAFAMIADEDTKGPTTRKGPGLTGFTADTVLGTLSRTATQWISEQAAAKKPFLLYLPFASPHTPVAPSAAWRGKSGVSPYADFVMDTDAAVGDVMAALEQAGVAKDTLVIVTSDNGFSPAANLPAQLAKGHNPCFTFRGTKADLFEGGHRVPFLVRWPAVVKPGSNSARLIGLMDIMATCAEVTGTATNVATAEDSVSFLPALRGDETQGLRSELVHHSINGSFAIRVGKWKLLLAPDSGGWSAPKPGSPEAKTLPRVQLYDLEADLGEKTNVHAQHPDVVRELLARLERVVSNGRSTPGAPQANHGMVDIWHGQPPFIP
jgi:arylsulfatase A